MKLVTNAWMFIAGKMRLNHVLKGEFQINFSGFVIKNFGHKFLRLVVWVADKSAFKTNEQNIRPFFFSNINRKQIYAADKGKKQTR